MKIQKKIMVLLSLTIALFGTSSIACGSEVPIANNQNSFESSIITPNSAFKTYVSGITYSYANFSDIPTTHEYSYYNTTLQTWMSGTLSLTSTKKNGSLWDASYAGYLMGSGL
ncbi:MAG: hypothetical protein ACERKN_12680 [Velocimicrobium sp.]